MTRYCHRCADPVYYVEEKRALEHSYHAECFVCGACGKKLENAKVEENRELDEIYCTQCYRRLFANGYGITRSKVEAVGTCNCCPKYHKRTTFCPNFKSDTDA